MLLFFLRRLLITVPTIFCVILAIFLLVHASPGNPFDGERALTPEVMQQLLHHFRLDLPLYKQFFYYLQDLLHGNFGESYKLKGQSINELIFPNNMGGFWVTLNLALYSMLLIIPLGIISGAYAGLNKNLWFDRLIVSLNMVFNSLPTIVTGPLFILIFAVTFGLFPSSGFGNADFQHLCLPVIALTLAYSPTISFVTRGAILDVLNSNFIRTAKAKGLPQKKIIFKHAIKPVLVPVVSLLGPMFAGILVGAIVTEQVFVMPGLGVLTTQGATNHDYNLVMAITIFSSILTIIFNFLVDVCYFMLDPKIKQ